MSHFNLNARPDGAGEEAGIQHINCIVRKEKCLSVLNDPSRITSECNHPPNVCVGCISPINLNSITRRRHCLIAFMHCWHDYFVGLFRNLYAYSKFVKEILASLSCFSICLMSDETLTCLISRLVSFTRQVCTDVTAWDGQAILSWGHWPTFPRSRCDHLGPTSHVSSTWSPERDAIWPLRECQPQPGPGADTWAPCHSHPLFSPFVTQLSSEGLNQYYLSCRSWWILTRPWHTLRENGANSPGHEEEGGRMPVQFLTGDQ